MEGWLHGLCHQVIATNEAEDGDVIVFVENTERV